MSDNSLLEKLKAEYEQKIAEMELRHKQEMDLMKEQLSSMRRLLFSSKSERTKIILPNPDQLSLFDEVEQETAPELSEEATTVKTHKRKKQRTQKKLDLSKAERNVVVLDIPEKDRHCPACGSDELVPVGKEHVRDEVRIIPAKIIVDEIYQNVYKCKACENDEHVEFVKAPTPKPLVPNSPVTPSVITATMLNKFQFALPLQRQEKLWQIMGLNLSKQTMANWIQYVYRDYLKPLIGLMKKQLLSENILHADETPVQVLKEKGRKNKSKSYMWLYATGQYAKHHIRVFEYQPSRAGACASKFLEGFHGYLHTDAYAGYSQVDDVIHCCCMAHARRKFVEALPENIEHPDETIPGRVIKEMGRLFKIEQDCQEISAEERQKQREKEAKPILLALFEYLEKEQGHVPQSSKLSKAINYCLSHRNELMNYLRDGDCSISNNLAERSIRPFTIGRKNWVFSGSPAGAEASAAAYSLIETCIANKVDTKEYLEYIFTNMSQEESLKDDSVLEKYLPWNVNLPTEE